MKRMVIPDSTVEACAAAMLARVRSAREGDLRRAEELKRRAALAANRLGQRFGGLRVWLFGSLAWGTPHSRSDVDLMVEGLPREAWLDAIGEAESIIGGAVDVVRAEDAAPGLCERVLLEGTLLHDGR
jgi:predicted nucleotidyltransferase